MWHMTHTCIATHSYDVTRVWLETHSCNTTRAYLPRIWRNSLTYGTWLTLVLQLPRVTWLATSRTRHAWCAIVTSPCDTTRHVTWLVDMWHDSPCDMTRNFIDVARMHDCAVCNMGHGARLCDMTHMNMWHDVLISDMTRRCVTAWLVDVWNEYVTRRVDITHGSLMCDSMTRWCVPCLIQKTWGTHIWHDPFLRSVPQSYVTRTRGDRGGLYIYM